MKSSALMLDDRPCSAMLMPQPTYSSRPVGPAEAFRRVDDLRKAVRPRVDARPDLTAARGILRDGHDDRHVRLRAGRQRAADQPRELREPPAGAAVEGVLDLADIDHRLAASEALGEAPPDRERQPTPILSATAARGSGDPRATIVGRRPMPKFRSLPTPSQRSRQ